eukprot:625232-Rhodomonas_salina.1
MELPEVEEDLLDALGALLVEDPLAGHVAQPHALLGAQDAFQALDEQPVATARRTLHWLALVPGGRHKRHRLVRGRRDERVDVVPLRKRKPPPRLNKLQVPEPHHALRMHRHTVLAHAFEKVEVFLGEAWREALGRELDAARRARAREHAEPREVFAAVVDADLGGPAVVCASLALVDVSAQAILRARAPTLAGRTDRVGRTDRAVALVVVNAEPPCPVPAAGEPGPAPAPERPKRVGANGVGRADIKAHTGALVHVAAQ